jgi:hypothetical protein
MKIGLLNLLPFYKSNTYFVFSFINLSLSLEKDWFVICFLGKLKIFQKKQITNLLVFQIAKNRDKTQTENLFFNLSYKNNYLWTQQQLFRLLVAR